MPGAVCSPEGLTAAGREGLGRLAAEPSVVLSSWLAAGVGSALGSALGSEMSTEPSTLALLWGRRGRAGAGGWPAVGSLAGAAVFDAGAAVEASAAPFGLSSCV